MLQIWRWFCKDWSWEIRISIAFMLSFNLFFVRFFPPQAVSVFHNCCTTAPCESCHSVLAYDIYIWTLPHFLFTLWLLSGKGDFWNILQFVGANPLRLPLLRCDLLFTNSNWSMPKCTRPLFPIPCSFLNRILKGSNIYMIVQLCLLQVKMSFTFAFCPIPFDPSTDHCFESTVSLTHNHSAWRGHVVYQISSGPRSYAPLFITSFPPQPHPFQQFISKVFRGDSSFKPIALLFSSTLILLFGHFHYLLSLKKPPVYIIIDAPKCWFLKDQLPIWCFELILQPRVYIGFSEPWESPLRVLFNRHMFHLL